MALKRFIDDVAVEVVEVKLVQSLPGLFTPLKVFEMPSELVSRIAGESDENRALRQQLDKKLQILEKGLRTCRQFASDRGVVGNGIKETRHLDGRAGQANALETPQTEAEDDSHPEDADSVAEGLSLRCNASECSS